MKCPYCMSTETSVLESRDCEDGAVTRRRRECEKCGKRFTTYERVEVIDLNVIKKSGEVEEFNRKKMRWGIEKACEKRPVSEEEIKDIIDEIEMRLLNRKSTEVSSSDIGRMILTRLKKLDRIAYTRFASVFLEFKSIGEFQDLIHDLQ